MAEGTPRDEPAEPFAHKRLGDFDLIREIGRGGMGVVYEAEQLSLRRRIALKLLPPGLGLTAGAITRFEREARAAAQLHHTNIVPVYAVGESAGCHYYAMELVDGQPLSRILEDLRGEGSNPLLEATVTEMAAGPSAKRSEAAPAEATRKASWSGADPTSFSDSSTGSRAWFDAAAKLVSEVAEALHYAHGQGIVHRDVKPSNLLLSKGGRLCLTDFGLARMAQEPGMTVSGSFLGTPAYMSPEQIAAGRVKLDHRTDIYSLGAVLYELLTSRRPFEGDSREEVLSGILMKEPKPPRRLNPRVPVDLETICLKAMEKDPDRRYGTAAEFAADLRAYRQHELIAARRAGPVRRTAKLARRHPVATAVVAATIVIGVLGGLVWRVSNLRAAEAAARTLADARLDMSEGKYREALGKVETVLAAQPELSDARMIRARLLIKLNRAREAVGEAESLLRRNPNERSAHLVLAAASRGMEGKRLGTSIEEQIKAVEAQTPDSSEAHYLRSLVAPSATDALRHLDRALEIDPGDAEALLERIGRQVELYRFDAALSDCDRLIAVRPRSAHARRQKAWVYYKLHDQDRALAEITKALELDPMDAGSYHFRGIVHLGLVRLEEALADESRAIELYPDDPDFHFSRADVLSWVGRDQEAAADDLKALELSPESPAAYEKVWRFLRSAEGAGKARPVMEQLKTKSADWTDPHARAAAHRVLASMYGEMGDGREALLEVEQAILLDPENWRGRLARARIRRLQQDGNGVESDCDVVARLELVEPAELVDRALEMSSTCRRPDVAIADLTRTIELAPSWAEPYAMRARAFHNLARYEESLADWTKGIALAPAYPDLFYGRGWAGNRRGRYQESLQDFETYIRLAPSDPWGYEARGWDLWALGRDAESLDAFDKCVELAPQDCFESRASANLNLGRLEEALADIDRAIELRPSQAGNYLLRAYLLTYESGTCERIASDLRKVEELMPGGHGDPGGMAYLHVAGLAYACTGLYDPRIALENARRVAEVPEKRVWMQWVLGAELYRQGRYQDAVHALEESLPWDAYHPYADFFLAMTNQRLGRTKQARVHYDRAVAWMEGHNPADLEGRRFREEAAQVLGLGASTR